MDIVTKIKELKKERNAIILAHNYQPPELQDIADFTGDSLGLSIQASESPADVIVFCGVYFMAETAKILSPNKRVFIPEKTAGCPLADMITAGQLRELKKQHPNAKTICYVNTTAEVKAECDFCCTSANAETMLKECFSDEDEIIFVPDKYLALYAAGKTGRNVIIWNGYCSIHAKILAEHIIEQKQLHPSAEVLVHPECRQEVIALADAVLSTSGMLRYAKESSSQEFIIATEVGMIYPLQKEVAGKKFYPATELAVCRNMKKGSLDKLLLCLEEMAGEVILSDEIIKGAQKSINNMIKAGRQNAGLQPAHTNTS